MCIASIDSKLSASILRGFFGFLNLDLHTSYSLLSPKAFYLFSLHHIEPDHLRPLRAPHTTMTGGQPQRRSSSVNAGKKTATTSSNAGKPRKNTSERSGHVLTATAPTKEFRSLPTNLRQHQQLLSANKVVFCFETEYTTPEVWTWLREYNKENGAHLSLFNELPNAIFVIQFEEADWAGYKRALLNASPLKVGEAYTSVNDFCLQQYPCNDPGFRHLVTVNIVQTNQELVGIIEFIIEGIGKFVKARQGTDPRRFSVVVETTLKLFPAFKQFHLGGPEPTKVNFDYRGRNLRCCYCFLYRHLSSQCRQPKPSLFAAPQFTADEIPTVKKGKGKAQLAQVTPAASGPRTSGHTAGHDSSRGRNSRVEQTTGDDVAAKHRRYRSRQRTGKLGEERVPSGQGLRSAEGPPDAAGPLEEGEVVRELSPLPNLEAEKALEKSPTFGLSAEGWSPHPSGRAPRERPASGTEGLSHSSPVFSQTQPRDPGTSGGNSIPYVSASPQGREQDSYRGLVQPRLDPGLVASTSRALTVVRTDNSPRKRLRFEFAAATSNDKLNHEREDLVLRPPIRNFKTIDLSQNFGIHSDSLPLPNHASVNNLLLQCTGSSIPDSQIPC